MAQKKRQKPSLPKYFRVFFPTLLQAQLNQGKSYGS